VHASEEVIANVRGLSRQLLLTDVINASIVVVFAEQWKAYPQYKGNFDIMTTSKATIFDIEGDHNGILEKPHVEKLAEIIKTA
jgi:hypothetical protein